MARLKKIGPWPIIFAGTRVPLEVDKMDFLETRVIGWLVGWGGVLLDGQTNQGLVIYLIVIMLSSCV